MGGKFYLLYVEHSNDFKDEELEAPCVANFLLRMHNFEVTEARRELKTV